MIFRRKPHRRKVLKEWVEKGVNCWLMCAEDFDGMYAGVNVIVVNGKVCASLQFADSQVIVYRDEQK